jgi:hypothetical protein
MRYIKPQTKWIEVVPMMLASSSAEFKLDDVDVEDDVVAGSRTGFIGNRRNIWDEGW